jgi:hypothetical protein
MAKRNVLNTNTINYLDLIGNGKRYRVPPYQRDYSWSEEQWEDLWNDLMDLRSDRDEPHYLGALVVEEQDDREFLIIDGQQRLATLSVLSLAVIERLEAMADEGIEEEANRERARELRNRFIGEKDPASLTESSRLYLNETDDAIYQDYLVQNREPRNPRRLPRSNRLLWECLVGFRKRLDKLTELRRDGRAIAALLSETMARQLLFILITVDDELNAYTVFETLNARGLELTTTDLLKNFLFSRVRVAADLKALQRRWRALMDTVEQERFPELLRYHMLCELPKVRSQRLFKLVRGRVKTGDDVFGLLDELERRAELFVAVGDPNHGYWVDLPAAKPYIRELTLFRVRQMMPLLFAAWESFSPDNFVSVLRMVSVLLFRYTVVSSRNPSALEAAFHYAAKPVADGEVTTPAGVFERLKPNYVDDAKTRQDFSSLEVGTSGRKRRLAKYILARLEADASDRACDPDTDPGTIEHILPENPTDEWEETFDPARWDTSVYRLGNLTLLESAANRSIGNAAYRDKVSAYGGSIYAISREIPRMAPEEWTPALLEARQSRLAARAVHLWRADFA